MRFDEYRRLDATAMADLVRRREVSAGDLLEAAIARAAEVQPRLNPIVWNLHEAARARAAGPLSGPFAGVPFLVKDLFQEIAGAPAAWGCRAMKDAGFRAPENSEYVTRALATGVVIFARTATPEFGAKGITEPEAFAPTRNPWNPDHTPGGSSGGSAAAVASGIVPMAGANDGGGSIRIPAACCGLFGLKPGRGRVPVGPTVSEMMHGAVANHVVSRSVRDSAAMLDALHGPEAGGPFQIAPPERPYAEEAARDPQKLRIAMAVRSPLGTAVDPEATAAAQNAAKLLRGLGHEVEEIDPPWDGRQLARDFLNMWFANAAVTVAGVRRATGCGRDGFELDTLAMEALGRSQRASGYLEGYLRWNGYCRALASLFGRHDLLLTPALATPPVRIGQLATPPSHRVALRVLLALGLGGLLSRLPVVEQMIEDNLQWVPYTQLANLTGVPAMSVPLHWTAGGLPLGVQFVAPVGGEGLLLRLAGQLERAQPWFDRVPA